MTGELEIRHNLGLVHWQEPLNRLHFDNQPPIYKEIHSKIVPDLLLPVEDRHMMLTCTSGVAALIRTKQSL